MTSTVAPLSADALPATFLVTREDAFDEGRFAALDAYAYAACPYVNDSFGRVHWRRGWRAGADLVRAQGFQPAT